LKIYSFNKIRKYFIIVWIGVVIGVVGISLFNPALFENQLQRAVHTSLWWGYILYFLLGCLRGFTLIPSTSLIVLGLLFFPPWPLFILTLAGILVSSASVYYFSDFLQLDEFFESKYKKRITQVKTILQKNELPIIIGWSFFPFLPTDLICYICGTLEVDFKKFLLGIFIGEAITCAIYIFGGHYLFEYFGIGL